MNEIGVRLKEERKRLKLNQDEMASVAGLKRMAQLNYEKGERLPDAAYLVAAAKAGVDVNYVITGIAGSHLSAEEASLIANYRAASDVIRSAAVAVLLSQSSSAPTMMLTGDVGQVVNGKVKQEKLTFNVGGTKRRAKPAK